MRVKFCKGLSSKNKNTTQSLALLHKSVIESNYTTESWFWTNKEHSFSCYFTGHCTTILCFAWIIASCTFRWITVIFWALRFDCLIFLGYDVFFWQSQTISVLIPISITVLREASRFCHCGFLSCGSLSHSTPIHICKVYKTLDIFWLTATCRQWIKQWNIFKLLGALWQRVPAFWACEVVCTPCC